jgi:hypothetical protein
MPQSPVDTGSSHRSPTEHAVQNQSWSVRRWSVLVILCTFIVLLPLSNVQAYDYPPYEGRALYVVTGSVGSESARSALGVCVSRYEYPLGTWPIRRAPLVGWGATLADNFQDVKREVVHTFMAKEIDVIKVFYEHGMVVVGGLFKTDDGGERREFRVIRRENPLSIGRFGHGENMELWGTRFYEIDGRPAAGVRVPGAKEGEPSRLALVDLDTLETTYDIPSNLRRYRVADRGERSEGAPRQLPGFNITLKDSEELGFGSLPPEGMWGDTKSRLVLHNGKDHLLLDGGEGELSEDKHRMDPNWSAGDQAHPGRRILHLTRGTGEWTEYVLKGNDSKIEIVGPWLTWRVGWLHPESTRWRHAYTGEWTMVHMDTLKCESIHFHGIYSNHARVLLAAEHFLLVADERRVKAQPVLEMVDRFDLWSRFGATAFEHGGAPHIQTVFFGPRKEECEALKSGAPAAAVQE